MKSRSLGILLAALLLLDLSGPSVHGIPISLPVLVIAFIAYLARKRGKITAPSWLQVAFLAALGLGLVPLMRNGLNGGIREVAQYVLMLGAGWMIFASADESERRFVSKVAAIAGVVLMAILAADNFAQARFLPTELSPTRTTLLMCLAFPFIVTAVSAVRIWKWPLLVGVFVLFGAAAGNGGLLLVGYAAGILAVALRHKDHLLAPVLVCAVAAAGGIVLSGADSWEIFKPYRPSGNLKRLYIEYEALPGAVAAAPVMGHGFGQYRDVIKDYFDRFPDADDNRIEPDTNSAYQVMAVEASLPATVLFVLFLAFAVGGGISAVRKDAHAAPFAAAALAILLAGLFTPVLTRNSGVLLALILGGAASFCRSAEYSAASWILKASPVAAAIAICAGFAAANSAVAPTAEDPSTISEIEIIKTSGPEQTNYVVIEAEDIIQPADQAELGVMKATGANDASFNCALGIPLGAGKGKGRVHYKINDLPKGSYTLWVRAKWTDGCSNSVGLIVGADFMIISDELFKRWHWVAASRPITVPGGEFQFTLKNLEDGVAVDQILLTPSTQFVPHGIMAAKKTSTDL